MEFKERIVRERERGALTGVPRTTWWRLERRNLVPNRLTSSSSPTRTPMLAESRFSSPFVSSQKSFDWLRRPGEDARTRKKALKALTIKGSLQARELLHWLELFFCAFCAAVERLGFLPATKLPLFVDRCRRVVNKLVFVWR